MEVSGHTIAEAWHASLAAFEATGELTRYDSLRGPCTDVQDLVLQVEDVSAQPILSDSYPQDLHALVDLYKSAFLDEAEVDGATVRDRLYNWGANGDSTGLDQVTRAVNALRESPGSRFTILTFWDPIVDPELENPVSPLIASLRARGGQLRATLVARSVDAWLGAFPMLAGFGALLEKVSEGTGLTLGRTTYLFLSYHVYDVDLPILGSISR